MLSEAIKEGPQSHTTGVLVRKGERPGTSTHARRKDREDTGRRQRSGSQGEKPQQQPMLLGP